MSEKETTPPTAQAATADPGSPTPNPEGFFEDIEALKLSLADEGLTDLTEEVLMRVPVRKPMKHEYARVRSGAENCFSTVIYEDKETREFYFVAPPMIRKLRGIGDVSVTTLVQFMTKQKVLGIWPLKIGTDSNVRTGWQDTMQADGADMMRLAAIAATEAGIEVCAPVHDAFLIIAPLEVLDEHVALMRQLMTKASLVVTGSVAIRTEAKTIRFPDRYVDEEGTDMWNLVVEMAGIPEVMV